MNKTIVQTRIESEKFVSTTPHAPDLKGEAETESRAVNALIAQIRKRQASGEPVEWIVSPEVKDSDPDIITRHLNGLWPTAIKPSKQTEIKPLTKENDHGD